MTSTYLRERQAEQMGDTTVGLVSALYQCFIKTAPLVWHQGLCLRSMSGVDTRAAYLKQVVSQRGGTRNIMWASYTTPNPDLGFNLIVFALRLKEGIRHNVDF